MNKKFSKIPITFALTTAIVVSGCSKSFDYSDDEPRTMNRAQYSSMSECARDWGKETECEQRSSGGARPMFYGPYYSGSHFLSSSGSALPTPSQINSGVMSQQVVSPSSFYSSGKYATGASNFASARSSSIASSRGGMVSGGRAVSSGG